MAGKASRWTDQEDDILCDMISREASFRKVADTLGSRTRNACIGRMHRIAAKYGEISQAQGDVA